MNSVTYFQVDISELQFDILKFYDFKKKYPEESELLVLLQECDSEYSEIDSFDEISSQYNDFQIFGFLHTSFYYGESLSHFHVLEKFSNNAKLREISKTEKGNSISFKPIYYRREKNQCPVYDGLLKIKAAKEKDNCYDTLTAIKNLVNIFLPDERNRQRQYYIEDVLENGITKVKSNRAKDNLI